MKKYTINEFLKMVKEGTMFPHYATIVTDYEVELTGYVGSVPTKKSVEEYECGTHDDVYILDNCNLEQLLRLIEECDFELVFHDKESLERVANKDELYDEDMFLNFTLVDIQGGNLANIEGEVFSMDYATEESFRDVLLSLVGRLENYLQDYCIQTMYLFDIEQLWKRVGEIGIDEDEKLCDDLYIWHKGTDIHEVWEWFGRVHPLGLVKGLMCKSN